MSESIIEEILSGYWDNEGGISLSADNGGLLRMKIELAEQKAKIAALEAVVMDARKFFAELATYEERSSDPQQIARNQSEAFSAYQMEAIYTLIKWEKQALQDSPASDGVAPKASESEGEE